MPKGANTGRGLWEGETVPIVALPDPNLGRVVEITRASMRRPEMICKADGSSIYSWTLTCDLGLEDVVYPAPSETARHGNVIAVVKWGHGAANFQAEVDMRQGAQFTVVATSITVSAQIDPEETEDDGLIISAQARAAIIWGTRPGKPICTRTQRRVFAENGGEAIVQIPNFSETLAVASNVSEFMTGATGPITLQFLAGPAATDLVLLEVDNTGDYFRNAILSGGIRFPEGARFLRVVNGAEDDAVTLSLIWGLYL